MTTPDLNPLGYTGIKERNPPNVRTLKRDPTINDYTGFDIGDFWINKTTSVSWQLLSKAKDPLPPHNTIANWVGFIGAQVTRLLPDIGIAVTPILGTIQISGNNGLQTENGGPALLDINLTGNPSFQWTEAAGALQTLAADSGFWANNGGGVAFSLPILCAVNSIIGIAGYNAGGWALSQNAGQTIHFDAATSTTPGLGGSLASTDRYDTIELLCTVANTEWTAISIKGNITII